MESKTKIVFLFGPTASGKSRLIASLDIAGLEVISADSMQVYRGLNIGTAKPSNLRSPVHHVINVCDPHEQFSVADFVRCAEDACQDILTRRGIPLVSGGTAYYFKHLLLGLPQTPASKPEVRQTLQDRLAAEGRSALHAELSRVDPASAVYIDQNNTQRLIRALEVYSISGKPLSSFPMPETPLPDRQILALGIWQERQELYDGINQRVHTMFQQGLEHEVQTLVQAGVRADAPAMKAIGYREFFAPTFYEAVQQKRPLSSEQRTMLILRIQKASRNYAKRQLTFFSKLPNVQWIHKRASNYAEVVDEIRSKILRFTKCA